MADKADDKKYEIPVSYRFAVSIDGNDAAFQAVSGITSTVETEEIREGGENLITHNRPIRITYDNLVLKRGRFKKFDLREDFMKVMHEMKLKPVAIQVAPQDKEGKPNFGGWIFHDAFLVKWSASDLSGDDNNLIIETMEFKYGRLEHVKP